MNPARLLRLLFAACVSLPVSAQDAPPPAKATAPAAKVARIPVQLVNGRLVTLVQLSAKKRIAANLFVDYDVPNGLLLHNKAAAGIECEEADGTPNPIQVLLPDITIEVAQREHGDEEFFNHFTKWYSKELGENAVVGVLGARVLSRYHVTFDLAAGYLELSPPHERSDDVPDVPGSTVVPITVYNDLAWCTVAFGQGQGRALGFATSKYDTWADRDLCDELGHPAGDIGAVKVAGIDLASYVPMRPEPLRHKHPDGVFGMTGLNLLQHFRVEIDRVNLRARWTPTRPAAFAQDDLAFYRARLQEAPQPIEDWLTAHKNARLLPEAAMLLLDLRLEQGGSDAQIQKAMQWVYDSWPADLKTTGAVELLQKMLQCARPAWAVAAAEMGLPKGREDRYPEAVHKLRARMGSVQLQLGKTDDAWKNLLSAAFGLPDDGRLNLDLARCYEAQGRAQRALSRYLLALTSPDAGVKAIPGLQRLMGKAEGTEPYAVDAVHKLIEGRVEGFGAATKYTPPAGQEPTRAVLVEQFGNAHTEGEQCLELARDGLRDFFGPHCVLVRYDCSKGELEPLVNELSQHMTDTYSRGSLGHVADGAVGLPVLAKVFKKQEAFEYCRDEVQKRLAVASEHRIAITASADATGVRGSVEFRGPAPANGLVAQILLIERGVVFPGRSLQVIHRNVARASLTEAIGGAAYAPKDGAMTVAFARTFAAIVAQNSDYLDRLAAGGAAVVDKSPVQIDPAQVGIVAILRHRGSGVVVQAAQWQPPAGGGK